MSAKCADDGGHFSQGDAVRVVNALLTQLDQLRRYKNALVLTTSNLSPHLSPHL